MSGWSKDRWVCEDCGEGGEDWGVPDGCPLCGSVNMTLDVVGVRAANATERTRDGS